jgi:hypothetical protein
MASVIFVGPTVSREEIATVCDFVCLPPVAQGDIYRAMQARPSAIGIVDGYFSQAPSIWHKEILWAMSQGTPVFGSASMGALRAAELHEFGMRGVGRIFEAYRDGTFEDDDEVAVVHGPAEIDYTPASEPMVNIRATLAAAEAARILSVSPRRALESFGKSLYFADRSWNALLTASPSHGVSENELTSLRDWLPSGRVDQKRLDSLEMITAMKEWLDGDRAFRPPYRFEWTYLWDEFVAGAARIGTSSSVSAQAVLDELRIEGPDAYARVEARALLKMIASRGAARPSDPPREALRAIFAEVRASLGLFARTDLDRWIAENELDDATLERLIKNEAALKALRGHIGPSIECYLLDELRLCGAYVRLARRAKDKREAINQTVSSGDPPIGLATVVHRIWYFEKRLGRPTPDDIDAFARGLGFRNIRQFDIAIYGEWAFVNNLKTANIT